MSVVASEAPLPARESRGFYVAMAVLCATVAFVGFAPSYWVPLAAGTLRVPFVLHLHGLFFFGWCVLLIVQTALISRGRIRQHRAFGVGAVALATAMVFTGVLAAMNSLVAGIAAGHADAAREFALAPLSGITFFAVAFTYAIANVGRPAVHKRAMLLATIGLLQPAIARWFIAFLAPPDAVGPPPIAFTVGPALATDLLLVAALVHDWRRRGKPHAVYVIGGGALVALQLARVPLAGTAAWHSLADALVRLAS